MKVRYSNLDILKIVAAVIIVFHHYQQMAEAVFSGINFFGGRFYFGYMVELFFMISGFVAVRDDSSRSAPVPYRKQFLHKCVRIYPSVMLATTVCLLVEAAYAACFGAWRVRYDLRTIVESYLLIFCGWFHHEGHGVNQVMWYLCVLILCYLLFFLVDAIARKTKWNPLYIYIAIAGIAFVQVFPAFQNRYLMFADARGFTCFFGGAAMHCLHKRIPKKVELVASGVFLCASAACFFLGHVWPALVIGLFPALILIALNLPQVQSKVIGELAGASFEVYVWHVPIYRVGTFLSALLSVSIPHSYGTMVAFTILVEIIAVILYRIFEQPVTKYLSARWNV